MAYLHGLRRNRAPCVRSQPSASSRAPMFTMLRRAALVVMALVVLLTGLPVHSGLAGQEPSHAEVSVVSQSHASDEADTSAHHYYDDEGQMAPGLIGPPLAWRRPSRGRVEWAERSFAVAHSGFGLDRPPRLPSVA